jgi:phosphoribosylanthranilate isomerase
MQGMIQVAGIHDLREAELVMSYGVDLLGFPLRLNFHREDCTVDTAAEIIKTMQITEQACLITYLDTAAEILELAGKLECGWVQIHGPIEVDELRIINKHAPHLKLIKSLVIHDDNAREIKLQQETLAEFVAMFITDTFDPVTGASGATGKTHDWNLSHQLNTNSTKPLMLAGGLNPENVSQAIRHVCPYGVDVHTGLEGADGRKDPNFLKRFVSNARNAFSELGVAG